jgi:lysyl-tRNA synthetase class 1
MQYTRKFDFSKLASGNAWADSVADQIIASDPEAAVYTTAAGISPSGVVHFGNFRDIVTSHLVRQALLRKGKKARLIFSWDNYDRFRKVPANVPSEFFVHIGKPLTKIPDPFGKLPSYAEHFQLPFIEAMNLLGIEIEYRNQTALYEAGTYDSEIFHALKERFKIADILLSFMTEKAMEEKGINKNEYRENYYPIAIYSRFTGKDKTKILNYDGATTVTYLCEETGKEDTVDLVQDHIAKLAWKADWPMRWRYEQVHFEPGGHDHASPGGSYDTSSVISNEIFGYKAPVFVEYKFVGIQGLGSKMSGSKGNAVSPLELLDIYEPDVLKWLYFRKSPDQSFELSFNTDIYRQYDEYDAEHPEHNAIPFRQVVGFGQVVQWQTTKLIKILDSLNVSYNYESINKRIVLAEKWLNKYNEEEKISLNKHAQYDYLQALSAQERSHLQTLKEKLALMPDATISEIETLVYDIPKSNDITESEIKKIQRNFFKNVYNVLISKDAGPRLSTFLWAADRAHVLALLDFDSSTLQSKNAMSGELEPNCCEA